MRESPEGFRVTPIAEVAGHKVAIWEAEWNGTRAICIEDDDKEGGCSCRHAFSPNNAFLLAQALLEAVTQATGEKR